MTKLLMAAQFPLIAILRPWFAISGNEWTSNGHPMAIGFFGNCEMTELSYAKFVEMRESTDKSIH